MTWDERYAIEVAKRALKSNGAAGGLDYVLLKLAAEAGETAGLRGRDMLRAAPDRPADPRAFSDQERAEYALELGDVLWYVTRAAAMLGLSLEEIAELNLGKLERRTNLGKNASAELEQATAGIKGRAK